MASSMDLSESDLLAKKANGGDRKAAGEFFRKNHVTLHSHARRIVRGNYLIEADDLLAESMAAVITLWAKGRGPTTNANAYIVRSMRNRMIDEFRSPRNRVDQIDDIESLLPEYIANTHHVDLHREYAYVLKALNSLSEQQQRVLRGIVIERRKPAELVEELGRPAAAISSLAQRSKAALRRSTLRTMLEEDAPSTCRHAAKTVPDSPMFDGEVPSGQSEAAEHARLCPRCRRIWATFKSMASALGIVSLMVAGTTSSTSTAHALKPGRAPDQTRRPSKSAAISSNMWGIVSGVCLILGAVIMVTSSSAVPVLDLPSQGQEGEPNALHQVGLTVTSEARDSRPATINVESTEAIANATLTVELPEEYALSTAPPEWQCNSTALTLTCRAEELQEGRLEFASPRVSRHQVYSLSIEGTIEQGMTVLGTARGGLSETRQVVHAYAIYSATVGSPSSRILNTEREPIK